MAFADVTDGSRVILSGLLPCKVTLGAACKPGDLLGYSSGWKLADANSSPKVYPELVAGESGASGDEITAYRMARVDLGSTCTATAGDKVYVSTTAGGYVGEASNDQAYLVGVMESAQIAFLNPYYAVPAWKVPNYSMTAASGHIIQIQLKPNLSATGTASVTCIELAPKVLDAVAAGTVQGISIALDLEGASAGTITTARGLEINLGSDSGTVRTVTNVHGVEFTNNMHGTVTNGPYCIKVNTHGGNVAWAGFALLPDDDVIGGTDTNTAGTKNGWVKLVIGSTAAYLRTYTSGI